MGPRIWIVVVLWALGPAVLRGEGPLPFDKLIKLEGKEFVKAADESSTWTYGNDQVYTVDELIALTEKLLPSVRPYGDRPDGYELSPFSAYFEPACEKADGTQLDRLIDLYRRLEPDTFEKSNTLPALAARVLEREIARLPAQHLELPDDGSITPPEKFESVPEELQSAWRMFQRANLSFNKAFPKPTERSQQIEVSANGKSFYNLIADVLGGATGKEEELRAFAWTGANCLNITDTEDAQDIALLLMLLREGRAQEAIGAALRVAGTTGSTSKPEASAKPMIDLLQRCGLDWEEIFAGGQVEKELKGWGRENNPPYLAALVRHSSARGAALIRRLAHFVKPEKRTPYVAAFSGWIATSVKRASCNGTEISLDRGTTASDTRVVRAMPMEVQTAVLHDIEEFATADSSEDLASHAINAFVRTQAPSSIPALRALTRHRSRNVVENAALILCAMGEEVKIPAAAGPVRFQILANGEPLPKQLQVSWSIGRQEGSVSATAAVLDDGVVELPREYFTAPEQRATGLELKTYTWNPGGVIFDTDLSPPWKLDELTKVNVKVSSLEIALGNREGLNAPPPDKAFLGFRRVKEEKLPAGSVDLPLEEYYATISYDLFQEENEISAAPSVRLPAIEEGKYRVCIGVPGAEIWCDTVVVGPNATNVAAKLKPASDVRFKIVAPTGERASFVTLLKDGKEMAAHRSRDGGYGALPCGDYVLRIPDSDFFERERPDLKTKRGPDEIPYKGRDVSFKVEKGSPAVIDLGEIRLEAKK